MAEGPQTAGRKRGKPDAARVAARVARIKPVLSSTEGVTPLNEGFFLLEQMRAANRKQKQRKLRGK